MRGFNLNDSLSELAFADALKSLARNPKQQYVQQSTEWYPIPLRAQSFVTGDVLEQGLFIRDKLDTRVIGLRWNISGRTR